MMVKNRLFWKAAEEIYTIVGFLVGSRKELLTLNKENSNCLNDKPVGKETL